MAKLLKLRRGTTSQHSSFTGAEGEVTVDTTKDTLVVHDGSTAGGHPIAKESDNLSLIDEDNMSTNSATRPPSQQSVKAYVDAGDLSLIDEDNMSTNSATRPPSQQSVKAYVDAHIIDEDNMSTNSATKPASQQSVKAYVDAHIIDEDNMASDSATKPPSQQSVKAYAAKLSTSEGTVGSSETVIVDADKDITGFRNVTLTGELDAATGDFSGDVDIDGTLEADAITVNSVTLSEYIADTVGAMVTGNTETGITVTYQDSDNTIDFATSGTASEATEVTVAANNSTDETVYPTFVDGASGAQGIETDTGLTYNPSTGLLSTAAITTTGNVTVGGNLQVDGTTTTVDSTTMSVADKNIELAKGAANDAAADGGGITLVSGDGNKTFNWVDSTDAWTSSEHIHLGDNKSLFIGAGKDLVLTHNINHSKIRDEGTGNFYIESVDGNIYLRVDDNEQGVTIVENGAVELYHTDSKKLETTAAGVTVTGTVTDSKGNLRTIPQLSKSSAHTIVASDAGKHSINSSGGWVFNTSTAFTAGQAITLINNSGSDQTITTTGVTFYNSADGSTPTKIATRGLVTVICTASNVYYASGGGLS